MGQKEDSEEALKKAIHDSSEVLVEVSTVFMFPKTTVTLSRTKMVIEKRSPFGGADIVSLDTEDLSNVNAATGPLFGAVTITTKLLNTGKPTKIGLFWRKDTIRLKRIIQGCIVAIHKKIDLSSLPLDELRDLLYQLGTDDHSIK
jgi:hypothetical protein